MLGYPTIIIPAIQGGDGREPTGDEQFHLNKEQISWISEYERLIAAPSTLFLFFSLSLTHSTTDISMKKNLFFAEYS